MKCIAKIYAYDIQGFPLIELDTVVCLSDDKAREMVKTGKYTYVPKNVWRIAGRKYSKVI